MLQVTGSLSRERKQELVRMAYVRNFRRMEELRWMLRPGEFKYFFPGRTFLQLVALYVQLEQEQERRRSLMKLATDMAVKYGVEISFWSYWMAVLAGSESWQIRSEIDRPN